MRPENEIFSEDGSDIDLRHFIYLDRQRLTSYVAQTSDGVTLMRRLLESTSQRETDSPAEKYKEEVRSEVAEGEVNIGANVGLGFGGKREATRTRTKSVKESDPTKEYGSFQALLEDKLEHDNLYLLLEQDLTKVGRLREIESDWLSNSHSGLVKATGIGRFLDWQSFGKLFEQMDGMWNQLTPEVRSSFGNNKNSLKLIGQLLKSISLGPLTLQMQVSNLSVISSLNPIHLSMTLDQLRVAYIFPGDVEITLVGFTPGKPSRETVFPGLAGSINMQSMWVPYVGETDLVIDPIAVYGRLI